MRTSTGTAAAAGVRRRVRRLVGGAAVLVALALVPAAASGARSRSDVILSNETTFTTWSIANDPSTIYAQPLKGSAAVAKVHFQTSDGFLQSYVLLRERFTSTGTWVELRIPGRPNGRTGWVPVGVLGPFQKVHTELVVDRAARTLVLYRNGRAIFRAPVGVGKPGTPTPPGHFWITESFPSPNPVYGPWAFGTSDYSVITDWPGGGIVGLHGTNEPQLVPGDPSHGCIRLHNSDDLKLKKLLDVGTPLLIQ